MTWPVRIPLEEYEVPEGMSVDYLHPSGILVPFRHDENCPCMERSKK
jgi:hypothetical protein